MVPPGVLMIFSICRGVLPLICVVNAPLQNERGPTVSAIVPFADSDTDVPRLFIVSRNGEPAKAEQESPSTMPEVQSTPLPGPSPVRSKCMLIPDPTNDMNPASPPLVGTVKSLIVAVPVKAGGAIRLPSPTLVTFVPPETSRHETKPDISGDQLIVVAVTATSPAAQVPTTRWPMTEAEADGGNVANANTARPNITDLSTFRCFTVFLRSLHWDTI